MSQTNEYCQMYFVKIETGQGRAKYLLKLNIKEFIGVINDELSVLLYREEIIALNPGFDNLPDLWVPLLIEPWMQTLAFKKLSEWTVSEETESPEPAFSCPDPYKDVATMLRTAIQIRAQEQKELPFWMRPNRDD